MKSQTIKLNINLINFYSFLIIIFFELSLLLPFFLTIQDSCTSSYGYFVYICCPILLLIGILLNKLIIKKSTSRLECFKDKIILIKKRNTIEMNVDSLFDMKFTRWWDFASFELGPGQVTFTYSNENKTVSVYLSKKDFLILQEYYSKH